MTLVETLAVNLAVSKREAKRLVDERSVFVNSKRVWIAKHTVMIGDRIEVVGLTQGGAKSSDGIPDDAAREALPILLTAGDALVVDKPAGVECVNGQDHIEARLRKRWPNARVVHRLDKDTSGCLLATTSEAAWDFFVEQFANHSIKKRYLALMLGAPKSAKTIVDAPLDGKSAKSVFYRKEVLGQCSLCEIELLTGRTHQIRRHARELGLTVLGDRKYGAQSLDKRLRSVERQMLHAWKLSFMPSAGSSPIEVVSAPPKDFSSWRRRLGGAG
jgi:RluA family pseudouridine synthase